MLTRSHSHPVLAAIAILGGQPARLTAVSRLARQHPGRHYRDYHALPAPMAFSLQVLADPKFTSRWDSTGISAVMLILSVDRNLGCRLQLANAPRVVKSSGTPARSSSLPVPSAPSSPPMSFSSTLSTSSP